MNQVKLFCGNSNPPLASAVASTLGLELGKADVSTFSDGEVNVEIRENVRGMDCFVIQSICHPANTHLMELLIVVDALRRSSARRITAVIPYYGYARQDRKVAPRTPITAKLVADLISVAGTDRVLCLDLHAGQIQGFFNLPVDNLYATPVLLQAIRQHFAGNLVVISPDAGGVERARAYAKRLEASLAIIDTAGTLTEGARALVQAGARHVYAAVTHPVLSGPAIKRIEESPLEEVVVTDTIPLRAEARECGRVQVVSIAGLLGEAIRRITNEESVSSLFV